MVECQKHFCTSDVSNFLRSNQVKRPADCERPPLQHKAGGALTCFAMDSHAQGTAQGTAWLRRPLKAWPGSGDGLAQGTAKLRNAGEESPGSPQLAQHRPESQQSRLRAAGNPHLGGWAHPGPNPQAPALGSAALAPGESAPHKPTVTSGADGGFSTFSQVAGVDAQGSPLRAHSKEGQRAGQAPGGPAGEGEREKCRGCLAAPGRSRFHPQHHIWLPEHKTRSMPWAPPGACRPWALSKQPKEPQLSLDPGPLEGNLNLKKKIEANLKWNNKSCSLSKWAQHWVKNRICVISIKVKIHTC